MALYNEILTGRYNRFLQKLFGIKGQAPVPQLGSEIMPVFPVFAGIENRYLEGWERFAWGIEITSGGGTLSGIRMRNPTGSNVIGVIESLILSAANTDAFEIMLSPSGADLTTIAAPANPRLDARQRPLPTLIQSSQTTTPAVTSVKLKARLLTNTSFQFINTDNQEIPLLPGEIIQGVPVTAAQTWGLSFIWRERFLEEPERA